MAANPSPRPNDSTPTPKEHAMKPTIAFIGLGTMGSPMARNLVKAGYSVNGWNRTSDRPLVRAAIDQGVTGCDSIQAAVAQAEVICVCVGDVPDVEAVLFNPDGVVHHGKNNALIIDFSTIGTGVTAIAAQAQSHGFRFLDAPISGGDIGAQQGTLTIMVGGADADFQEARPLLGVLGKNIVHCGPLGSGQAVKLCNQVLASIHMVALCEAIALAKQLNLDPQLMVQVCQTGAAGSWALENLGPKIVQGDYAPGFMVKHILKDLRLVAESGGELSLGAIALATEKFQQVAAMGGSDQGTQAMIRAYGPPPSHQADQSSFP